MRERSARIAALIVKSLQDDLSGPEQQELQEWVGQSESNRLFFERFKDEEYLLQNLKRHAEAREHAETIRPKLDALIAENHHKN